MDYVFAFLAGTAASFINTFAGGGSLITLPFLLFLGLPAPVANGTNKIGLIAGTFTSTANFYKKKIIHWKDIVIIAPSGMIGGIVGSMFALDVPDDLFKMILSIVMVVVLVLILVRPQRFLKPKKAMPEQVRRIILALLFLIIGFYAGFIQAGMGFLVIISLTLFGSFDLVKISAFKAIIGFIIVVVSSLVFIINGSINWWLALALAGGNALGGWLGSSLAIKHGERIVRPILVVVVLAMAVKLSGIWDWFLALFTG